MKINFEITDIPTESQVDKFGLDEYIIYLEGIVTITINDKIFFQSPGILLIELARCIHAWLKKIKMGLQEDFIYETMDYYEDPILYFKHVKNELYKIDSVWQKKEIKDFVGKDHIVSAFEKYLNNLNKKLKKKFNIELSEFWGRIKNIR